MINDPVIYTEIEDIASINGLFYSHGISVYALTSTTLLAHSMRPNTVYIYVVYSKDDANVILQQEIISREGVTGAKLVGKFNSDTEDIFACSCYDNESELPMEKFNLGISLIFIIKKLNNPLIKY